MSCTDAKADAVPIPRRVARALRRRLRAGDESGVILALSAIMLVVIIGFAALAIDIGSFYQDQRQVQGSADSAALLGADELAAGTSTGTVTTDVNALVAKNTPGATPNITINGNTIAVTVSNQTPSYFGRIFNVTSEHVSARAVASGQATTTPCTSSGANCAAVFAMDSNCSHYGVSATAGSINITGTVHSNGSVNDQSGGSTWGATTYGPTLDSGGKATGCNTVYNSNQETIQTGPASTPVQTGWPIDYAKTYPACSGAACTGPSGTPSYCTYAAANFPVSSTPTQGIYCAYGTGTPSDPATYNGAVDFTNGGFPVTASYICGTVSINAGINSLTPYNYPANHMLFYATSSATAINFAAGGYPAVGDSFAPNGTIAITAGINATTFLEAQDVNLGAGGYTITGDGPQAASGGSSSGTASLTQ